MNGKEISEALKNGKRIYGSLVMSTSPKWAAEINKLGMDFVFIDTEHVPIDRAQISWMCQTYKALNLAPIVRISSPDPYKACEQLDGGAVGIITPYTETVQQVKDLVGAVKYRPLKGKKLYDVLDGKIKLDKPTENYLKKWNEGNLLFLNIESAHAMDNLDEILSVPGIDGVIIGPNDLSINLGIPDQYRSETFEKAVRIIIKKARARNLGVGNHFSFGTDQQISWIKECDMNIILDGNDLQGFVNYIGNNLKKIKNAVGDQSKEVDGNIII
jgi:2-keto-3-deoxy-L-rhamnonate aldolase RhmA